MNKEVVTGGNAVRMFKFLSLIFTLGIIMPFFVPYDAHAIPAFARQYNTECSTCHTIFPQRNEFGDAFKKNGYVWPGSNANVKNDRDKEKITGVKWPIGIPKEVPIAFLGESSMVYDKKAVNKAGEEGKGDRLNMKNYALELFAGGNFDEKVSFFVVDVIGESESEDGEQVESSGVEELFAMYRHAFGSPINIKAGKFMPQISIWKENNKLISATPVTIDFAVDEANGETPLTEAQYGIELNSVLGSRLFVAAGVLDPQDRDVHEDAEDNTEGVKGKKDYFGHVSYKIGGTDFLGNESEVDLEKESVWDFLTITVGAFGYKGNTLDPTDNSIHGFNRIGLEAGALYKKLNLMLSGVKGTNHYSSENDNPAQKSKAVSAELDYQIASQAIAVVRYDYVHINNSGTAKHIIPAIIYAPLQNFRISLEVDSAHEKDDESGETHKNTTGSLNLAYSF